MKTLFAFVTLLTVASCLSWDSRAQVQDTPEVAAAKAAHFAILAKAKQRAQDNPSKIKGRTWTGDKKTSWTGDSLNQLFDHQNQNDDGSWREDESWKNYDDGSWTEKTDEKFTPSTTRKETEMKWTGPVALPPGYDEFGAPLQVEDTPEVAAAKAKHLLLYAQVASKTLSPTHKSVVAPKKFIPSQQPLIVRGAADRHPNVSRTVPLQPAPIYEVDDVLQSTREVAAAKAAYYTALAKRLSR